VGFFSCVAREQKSSFSPDQGGKKSALINDSESIVELERERERERERGGGAGSTGVDQERVSECDREGEGEGRERKSQNTCVGVVVCTYIFAGESA
jgi:hypothetical protein